MPLDTCRNKTQIYREKSFIYPNFDQYVAGNIMPQGIPSANDITASSVASVQVGMTSSAASQATLSASTGQSSLASATGSAAGGSNDNSKHGAAAQGAYPALAAGSAALAAVGGAAALFV